MKNLVDGMWTCGCGAFNAEYLTMCGSCNVKKGSY